MVVVAVGCRDRGHTLVELVVAFAVLSVLGIGLSMGRGGHGRAVRRGFQDTVALRAAQAQIERLRAGGTAPRLGESSFDVGEAVDHLPSARGWLRVTMRAPGLLELAVEVRWLPAGSGSPAVVGLHTLFAVEAPR